MRILGLAMVLVCSACAVTASPGKRMFEGGSAPTVRGGSALVSVHRPARFGGNAVYVEMWDGENYIGQLGSGQVIHHLCAPGKHTIVCFHHSRVSVVSADLYAGRAYDLFLGTSAWGGWILTPVKADDSEREDVTEWLAELKVVSLDPSKRAAYQEKHRAHIAGAIHDFTVGKKTSRLRHLAAADYR